MDEKSLLHTIQEYVNYYALEKAEPGITRSEIDAFFVKIGNMLPEKSPLKRSETQSELYVYIDGAARGNPGPAAVGCIIKNTDGKIAASLAETIGNATNNVAEYQALLHGLELAESLNPELVTIISDSELLVKQMTGKFKARDHKLIELRDKALKQLAAFPRYSFRAVPRSQNWEADSLANKALDEEQKGIKKDVTMKLTIALAQISAGSNPAENVEKGIRFLKEAAGNGAKIICYPEMSFCPFFPQYHAKPEYFKWAKTIPGPLVKTFQDACKQHSISAIVNMYEKEAPGQYFDCSPVINENGEYIGKSQMMHIAELPNYNEKYYYWEGKTDYPVFHAGGVTFGIAICYDRHFPEQIRILTLKGAEIIFVPTATSLSELKNIWEVEMQAASVANQVYIAVVNHCGTDDKIKYFGRSFITNPFGDIIAMAGEAEEELLIAEIDLDVIEHARQKLPFLRDRRPETYDDLLKTLKIA